MARGPIGERMAVVEREVAAIRGDNAAHHAEVKDALAAILKNQEAAKSSITSMQADISAMKPHVETVAAAKTFWAVAGWISLKLSMIGGAVYGAWVFIHPYIKFPWQR